MFDKISADSIGWWKKWIHAFSKGINKKWTQAALTGHDSSVFFGGGLRVGGFFLGSH